MGEGRAAARDSLWRTRHPALLVTTVLLAPALWVAFVGSSNPHELLAGVPASLATIVFTVFVCRSSPTDLALRPRDVLQLWRIPWYIVSDVWVITLVLFKDLLHIAPAKSLYRVCGFDTSTHDPVRAARTVLAVMYTTCGPNSVVIGVDPAQSLMLFHQIETSTVSRMTQALGAKP